jgi:hypothetical protein
MIAFLSEYGNLAIPFSKLEWLSHIEISPRMPWHLALLRTLGIDSVVL